MNAEKVRVMLAGISPAPWTLSHYLGESYLDDGDNHLIVTVSRTADAALIAAAPDIARAYLAQAEEIQRLRAGLAWYADLENWHDPLDHWKAKKARAALEAK